VKFIKVLFPVIGLSFLCSSVVQAEEVTRIAFVNTTQLIEASPQAAVVSEKLQSDFAPREAKLVEEQNGIKLLEEKLVKDGALMSATEKRKLERNIKSKQMAFQSAYQNFVDDLNARRKEALQKLNQEIAVVVVEVAKQANFDMVLEAGVVYANEKVNITSQVIEALKKGAVAPAQ